MGVWKCPICKQGGWGKYPYEEIVNFHKHPIRRYLTGNASYGKWLEQYFLDLQRVKSKK
jgi:hypothetical protein